MNHFKRAVRMYTRAGRRSIQAIALASLGWVAATTPAHGGEVLFGLTSDNRLLSFDSNSPGLLLSNMAITGLQPGETVLGIDMRPTTGTLYGLGSSNRIYVFDWMTGNVSSSTELIGAVLNGGAFGVDFNPVADSAGLPSLRVVSNDEQNLRINVNTGVVTQDSSLLAGNPLGSVNPTIGASAYSNNRPGAATTRLYNIDFNFDRLVIQFPANDGTLARVGELGPKGTPPIGLNLTNDLLGFDISGFSGDAFASLTDPSDGISRLYTVNLDNGSALLTGLIGNGETLRGLTVRSVPEPSTWMLLGASLLGLIGVQRRRRR